MGEENVGPSIILWVRLEIEKSPVDILGSDLNLNLNFGSKPLLVLA